MSFNTSAPEILCKDLTSVSSRFEVVHTIGAIVYKTVFLTDRSGRLLLSCSDHSGHPLCFLYGHQVSSLECLARPLPRPVSALLFTVIGLRGDRRPDQRLKSRCLFQADQVVLHIREKSRKTDPDRILSGSIYSRGFGWTDRRKHVPHRQTTEIESLGTLPRELTQISHSDASDHNLTSPGAARYFDYESAVALRNLAAAYGTDMPRYLLAPEVAVLLSRVPDLRKRLFIDALWNSGGRLNEILPLTKEDFVLDDPLTGAGARRRKRSWPAGNRGGNPGPPAAGGSADRSGIRATLKGVVCDGRLGCRGAALGHKE